MYFDKLIINGSLRFENKKIMDLSTLSYLMCILIQVIKSMDLLQNMAIYKKT